MFPLKKIKKNSRLPRLGEQPLHQKYKNEGGERFCIQKLLPPSFQKQYSRDLRICGPRVIIFRIFDSVLRFISSPTSIPSLSFLAFHWCILIFLWCSRLWECTQIRGAIFVCFLLDWVELRICMR